MPYQIENITMNRGTGYDTGHTGEAATVPHWYTWDEVTPRHVRMVWADGKSAKTNATAEYRKPSRSKAVKFINVKTGEIHIFKNKELAAAQMNIVPTTLQWRISKKVVVEDIKTEWATQEEHSEWEAAHEMVQA